MVRIYSAEKARGAAIIMHRRWERVVFFASLAAIVLLLLIADLVWR